jgi:hypothetical protein
VILRKCTNQEYGQKPRWPALDGRARLPHLLRHRRDPQAKSPPPPSWARNTKRKVINRRALAGSPSYRNAVGHLATLPTKTSRGKVVSKS